MCAAVIAQCQAASFNYINTVHTGKYPHSYNTTQLQKPSPTNLFSGFKFLLSRFIALGPTILVTPLERHHQCWTKQNAKLRQQPRPQKSYKCNNSTAGSKPELVHGLGSCRGIAATTAAAGMVSPRLASMMMLPNDIAHRRRHSIRRATNCITP